jgi:trigger factor
VKPATAVAIKIPFKHSSKYKECCLDVNIVDKSSWEKTIEVAMPTVELHDDFEKAYKNYRQKIQLEGFRRGKVPVELIKKIFGKDIQNEVAEKKISDILEKIGVEHNYSPISPVKLQSFTFTNEDGLKFTALLEIVPTIELDKYKGFKVERDVYQVDNDDVDATIENLRKEHAKMQKIDGAAEIGHYLLVDFQGLDSSGVPLLGEKFENRFIRLLDKTNDKTDELSQQLVGVKINDERRVQLTQVDPENQQERIDHFLVTVKGIEEEILPELNDQFAESFGEFKTMDDLKKRVKDDLIEQAKLENENSLHERIIDEIVKANSFEVPEPMIKNYLDLIIENMRKDRNQKIDEQKTRDEFRTEAIWRLKWSMLKDKICEIEQISIDNEAVNARIDELAANNKRGSVHTYNYFRNAENKDHLKEKMLDQKVFEFLKENVDIKERKLSRKDLQKKSKIITK